MADTQHGRSDPYKSKKQETDIKMHSLIMYVIYTHSLIFNLVWHYTTTRIFIQNKIVQSVHKTDIQQPEKHLIMKPTIIFFSNYPQKHLLV